MARRGQQLTLTLTLTLALTTRLQLVARRGQQLGLLVQVHQDPRQRNLGLG